MPEKERCADRAGEGNEVQDNVVNRGNEWSVDHVRDRDHEPARESSGQHEKVADKRKLTTRASIAVRCGSA